ncbi:SPPL3, partial [Symbiodinium pilosum]
HQRGCLHAFYGAIRWGGTNGAARKLLLSSQGGACGGRGSRGAHRVQRRPT